MKSKRGRWIVLLLAVVLAVTGFPIPAAAKEKIRVGIEILEGYHEVDDTGHHTGYDYEYLMELARYTGWEYEFVEGSWDQCISRMQNGEIDLLGGVEKTSRREADMAFGSEASMHVTNCLLTGRGSDSYAYEDFQAFDGMRIGVQRGSSMISYLEEYSIENGFTYQLKQYETELDMQEALAKKEVDCLYMSDFRNLSEYKVIARFGYIPYYYVTNLDKPELKVRLDSALRQIHAKNRFYETDLYRKHFDQQHQVAFTREENTYIADHRRVRVALFDDMPLICEYDAEQESYTGTIIDLLNELSRRTGFQFEYTRMPEGVLPWDFMKDNPNVLVAPFKRNSLIKYGDPVKMLDTLVEGKMVGVRREDHPLDLDGSFDLVIQEGMYGAEKSIQELFPHARLRIGGDNREGLNMVRDGRADMTLMSEISAAYLLQSPYYKKLRILNIEELNEDITIALCSESDPLLISILNEGIASFDERDIRQISLDNTAAGTYRLSPGEWLYQNWLLLFLTILLLTVSGAAFFDSLRRRKKREQEKQEQKLEKERRMVDQKYREKMFYQANFDKLTGLYNQGYFVEQVNALMAANPHVVYAFFQINIVKFKVINELFGKSNGDYILMLFADMLREKIGQKGIYGRTYADHFVICYPAEEKTIQQAARENTLYFECRGQRVRTEINVGVYVNTQLEKDSAQLLEYTQIALQNSEKSDDTLFCFYREAYFERLLKNQKIANEMESALREGQFKVFLQPQFDHITGTLVGAEALVRWFHPTEGVVPPNVFIPVFEENHFICKLDEYICEQVCRLLKKWEKQGRLVPVSINLSRIDLQNRDLPSRLQEMIRREDIPASYLHVEITESAYVENNKELLEVIKQLRRAGFVIEMDDFGSGYSSLHMLKDIPVDVLKLDMQFFGSESHMDKGGSIIAAIISLADSLGLTVIAEGLETEREANFLKMLQCHLVQGYLYGRPVSVEEFEELLCNTPIEKKLLGYARDKHRNDHYWELEKYNVLLRNDETVVFDYDPFSDNASITFVKDRELKRTRIAQYMQSLSCSKQIHPDHRKRMQELLGKRREGREELEFQADYRQNGQYEWFHADIYYYCSRAEFSRVIAVIRKKQSA